MTCTIFKKRRKKCLKKEKIQLSLAWNLLFKICANILDSLKLLLLSEKFANRHKTTPTAFTRNRKLPFHLLVCFLINLIKNSYQVELNFFFKSIFNFEVAKKIVSKAALCKARQKVNYTVFIELNQHLIRLFESCFKLRRWNGFRLLAEDGSMCRPPNLQEIAEHFGAYKVKKGKPCAMARISQLYDTLNKVSVAATITPKKIDERQHAYDLFLNLMPKDLVLLDRGYPAFWLFKAILTMDADFCARINDRWKVVQHFIQSGAKEEIVTLHASPCTIRKCKQLGLNFEPVNVRLLRIELDSGEIEVLITSLTNFERYPHGFFKELYHKRWPVEEDYKAMKCWLQLENFSGKTVLSVYQDFYAKIFYKNLASVISYPVQRRLDRKGIKKKHRHQVNFAQTLSNMKGCIALLFQRPKDRIESIVKDLQELIETEPIRPGRKFPRKHKASVRRYYVCYKAGA
jgi:hypothetical protein